MAQVVTMPRLGVTMTEGRFIRWLKEVGEEVDVGEPLFEVETDKVTMEVESLFGGVLMEVLVKEETVLPIGAPIGIIGKPGEIYDREALLRGGR